MTSTSFFLFFSFWKIKNRKNIPIGINNIKTACSSSCSREPSPEVKELNISSVDGKNRTANTRIMRLASSKSFSMTNVETVEVALNPFLRARLLARINSPIRAGKTLFPRFPIAVAITDEKKETLPTGRRKYLQRQLRMPRVNICNRQADKT